MDCILSDIKNAKLGTGRSSQEIEGYGGGPLWRRRAPLGCSANEEEEEEVPVLCGQTKEIGIVQGRN